MNSGEKEIVHEQQLEDLYHPDYIGVIRRCMNEYFSLSLIGMADDEILRAEMVSQLCMNDRTHSSLLDLVSSLLYQPLIHSRMNWISKPVVSIFSLILIEFVVGILVSGFCSVSGCQW